MIKYIINTFVAIAACLGVAAFILVLIPKQNCQTKEKLVATNSESDVGDELVHLPEALPMVGKFVSRSEFKTAIPYMVG